MASPIDVPKLVQAIADAYDVGELRGFLGDRPEAWDDHPASAGNAAAYQCRGTAGDAYRIHTSSARSVSRGAPLQAPLRRSGFSRASVDARKVLRIFAEDAGASSVPLITHQGVITTSSRDTERARPADGCVSAEPPR